MPWFAVNWPDGDVSLVEADDTADAMVKVDELGSPEPRDVQPLDIGRGLFFNLCQDEESGRIMFADEQGETMIELLQELFPGYDPDAV